MQRVFLVGRLRACPHRRRGLLTVPLELGSRESVKLHHEIAIRTFTRQRCHVGALVRCRGAPTRKGGRALMSGQSCGGDEAWVALELNVLLVE